MELKEDKEKRECIYSNNTWMIIRRCTNMGTLYSVVRKFENEFKKTFVDLIKAIEFADTEV